MSNHIYVEKHVTRLMDSDRKLEPKECYIAVAYDDDKYHVIGRFDSVEELEQFTPEDALPALEYFDFFQYLTGTIFFDFCDTTVECKYNEETKKWRIVNEKV